MKTVKETDGRLVLLPAPQMKNCASLNLFFYELLLIFVIFLRHVRNMRLKYKCNIYLTCSEKILCIYICT
jgi:hypothetical protein